MSITPYMKAVVGGLAAGLAALGTAMTDDKITSAEWVGVAVATIGALSFVYATPNRHPDDESGDPDDESAADA